MGLPRALVPSPSPLPSPLGIRALQSRKRSSRSPLGSPPALCPRCPCSSAQVHACAAPPPSTPDCYSTTPGRLPRSRCGTLPWEGFSGFTLPAEAPPLPPSPFPRLPRPPLFPRLSSLYLSRRRRRSSPPRRSSSWFVVVVRCRSIRAFCRSGPPPSPHPTLGNPFGGFQRSPDPALGPGLCTTMGRPRPTPDPTLGTARGSKGRTGFIRP